MGEPEAGQDGGGNREPTVQSETAKSDGSGKRSPTTPKPDDAMVRRYSKKMLMARHGPITEYLSIILSGCLPSFSRAPPARTRRDDRGKRSR